VQQRPLWSSKDLILAESGNKAEWQESRRDPMGYDPMGYS